MTLADIRSQARPKHPPVLDPGFLPAALYNRDFREEIQSSGAGRGAGLWTGARRRLAVTRRDEGLQPRSSVGGPQ